MKQILGAQPVFLAAPGPGYKGDWHHVEAFFELNSIQGGRALTDGVARYWFDGVQVINANNIQFRTAARSSMLFNQLMVSPYIGDGSPVDQSMWIDELIIRSSRP